MNVFWVLLVGVTGWLAGKLIGEKGYGEALGGYADGLDIVLGIVGASMGGYLLLGAVGGEVSSFSRYATAILGSITLVGVARLVSARYLSSGSR
ncbi:MAG: GlsB/YeaQ/YmgE family stress response membrane protein [Candidatus Binatia bacterium]